MAANPCWCTYTVGVMLTLLSAVSAQYMPVVYLPTCYSSFAMFATMSQVRGPPSEPVTLFTADFSSTSVSLDCLDISNNGPQDLSANQSDACNAFGVQLFACISYADNETATSCRDITDPYLKQRISQTQFTNSSLQTLSIQWMPNISMPLSCYPRYLTTVLVTRDTTAGQHSSLATAIVFVIIAAVVLVVLGAFGQYQIRKALGKFQRKVKTTGKEAETEDGPAETDNADEPQPVRNPYEDDEREMTEEEFRSRYGEHAIRTQGAQHTELVNGVVVTSKPLVQPWYQRAKFVAEPDSRATKGISPGVRRRQLSPGQYGGNIQNEAIDGHISPQGRGPQQLQFSPPPPLDQPRGHHNTSPAPRKTLNPYEDID